MKTRATISVLSCPAKVGHPVIAGARKGIDVDNSTDVVPAKAGTHTLCPLDRLRRMGPGSAAGTTPSVFDLLAERAVAYPPALAA